MADKKTTFDNGLIQIEAGQTVENFLQDINNNFSQVPKKIEGAPTTITFSLESPKDGNGVPGDIWIQYEE